MPTEYWFPTPIYYNMIHNVEEVQKELFQIMENISFHKSVASGWDKNTGSFSDGYNENENFLEKYKPLLFLNELQKNLALYFEDLKFCPIKCNVDIIIKESWLTKLKKNEYHHQHLHPNSELSGVYYVKANCNHGNLSFTPPSLALDASRVFAGRTNNVDYKPEVGKLILWPSLVEHHVVSNQTDEDRISLSFNIVLRDRI